MKFKSRILALLLFVVSLTSCKKDMETLHIYSALDSEEVKVYVDAFEKDTGTKVKWVRMSAGEVLARLEAEKNNPQVSVWFGGPSTEFIVSTRKGLLQSYQPETDYTLSEKQRDTNWNWVGIYFGAIGFASNEKLLKEKGLAIPESWDDLLKKEYKGLISMAYPYTSGTSYTVVSALLQGFGTEKGWAFLEKLNEQIHHYNKSGSAAITQAGIGEIGVGIAFSQDILTKGQKAGYPIALTFPKEGTGFEIGGMALVKGAPTPDLGKKFINYFLSTKGQTLFKDFNRTPLNPHAPVANPKLSAANMNLMPFDALKAADEHTETIDKWKKITGR